MKKCKIILPARDGSNISDNLVKLTKYLTKKVFKGVWQGGGLLGGEYGYGVDFENDTFMMRPYCWCEREDCKWCSGKAPNFLFKPTGAAIKFYKYIGRSQEIKGKLPKNWLEICKKSVCSPKS